MCTNRFRFASVLAVLTTPVLPAADVFVRQGLPVPLEREPGRVVVRSRMAVNSRAGEVALAARVAGRFSTLRDLTVLEVDREVEDVGLALERLRSHPEVEFAAPLYRGRDGARFTVISEAVVRFRSGTPRSEREAFYDRFGFEPEYEYPPRSGRVVCHVLGGQRERDVLGVISEAYFDDRVEHVSPGFVGEHRLHGDCYDPSFEPPGCNYMGPGDLDCPGVDPSGCLDDPVCPPCDCTRFSMSLPNGPGDDEFADEMHQFDAMGIWDAWSLTRGDADTRILVADTRVDRDHRDVGPQVVLDLDPENVRGTWGPVYSVTLPPQESAPAFIYFHFVDPPDPVVSGTSLVFHIDNLQVRESGPQGMEKVTYSFEDAAPEWQTAFSIPGGSNHAFSRVAESLSGCASDFQVTGAYVLRVEAAGAGDALTHHIRVAVPGLEAGKPYWIGVQWVPGCVSPPPLEGFVRFGIDGDQGCEPRFGREMGRAGESLHGTTVSALACGADNSDGYGSIGVAPDSRVVSVAATTALLSGDATALLAAARTGISVMNSSVQLSVISDDYLDAYRTIAQRGRGGLGAPLSFSAGNEGRFIHQAWISASELATSVGALALVTPMAGEPYWTRGCSSSYGADVWVLDHRVFEVAQPWEYETFGFTFPDLEGADGDVPGDFHHFDDVQEMQRRVATSTSWCAPVVSGIYALMLSRDSSLTREEVEQILYHTAKRPDANGRIDGVYLDCALVGGPCLGGVDPSPGCRAFPTDPDDASYVDPALDIPFDPVTSRSRVFGYGLVDALAAVEACDPADPKRWPQPPLALTLSPGKTAAGSRRVRVSWLPREANREHRGYDGYILVRSFGAGLDAPPVDGAAPPPLGGAIANGVVVARGDAASGTLQSSYEDTSTTSGLRAYSLFYYRKMAGPQDYFYSFGKEARIVYSASRWKTVSTYAALAAEIAAGLDSGDPTKAVVLFVDASTIALPSCLELGANIRGSEENGRVWIVGDKSLGGTKTRLIVPNGQTGFAICGSRHLSVRGFTVDGGAIGLGVWKSGQLNPSGGCPTACSGSVRADEIEVSGCRFEENQIGAWLENAGDVVLQNCVFRATGTATHTEAAGVYFPPRAGPNEQPNDHRTLYSILNNTIDVVDRPALRIHMRSLTGEFPSNAFRPRLQVFNNVLRASGSLGVCVEHGQSGDDRHLSNHNDFVVLSPAQCGRIAGGPSYPTLSQWRLESQSDKHSCSVDPGFVNVGTGDYHLASRLSPVINAGTAATYEPRLLGADFDGWAKARMRSGSALGGVYRARYLGIDIGADEFESTVQSTDADLGFPFLRGDANNDADVDVSDPIFILLYLFSGGGAPTCFDAADANDDEVLDISDATALMDFLFQPTGGVPFPDLIVLPEPYPFCGFDLYRVGDAANPGQSPYHCGSGTQCP